MNGDNGNQSGYYYTQGRRIDLVAEPNVYAVRFRPGRTQLSPEAMEILRGRSNPVTFIPHYGIRVYQTGQLERAVGVLSREPSIEFATRAYQQTPGSSDLMFVTRRFVAQFKPEVSVEQIDELNRQHGVRLIEPLDYAENGYLLEAEQTGEGTPSVVELANRYYESGLTIFAHPDFIRTRHVRRVVASTATTEAPAEATERGEVGERAASFLDQQWHLATARVRDAWSITRGDADIRVAILDDGVDTAHQEFTGKVAWQWDYASNTADGTPKTAGDNHGTACAGVAVASGVQAFGAAPNCRLMAVKTPNLLGVADEAKMFKDVADNEADVISCSWGPADGTGTTDLLPDNVRAAIHFCVTRGRDDKGIPVFWAAGNGDESVSLDGYAANPEVMAVAASTSRETRSWYSDFGPEIWVCAPSNGDSTAGERSIFTVDRRGIAGYNSGSAGLGDPSGNYTNDFGGTSSATPLVAGIAALLLSVNPNLKARYTAERRAAGEDPRFFVDEILKRTADKIGSGYDANGHSQQFGYGRVNAQAAVREAQTLAMGGGTVPATGPSIQAPARVQQGGGPPQFQVNPSPNAFWSVEIATRPELFDLNHPQRTSSNAYGTWEQPESNSFMSGSSYSLHPTIWDRLKVVSRLYYRLHTSGSNTAWTNYDVTEEERFIEITADGATNGSTTPSTPAGRTISYPSGLALPVVDAPADGRDYRDPTGEGAPLVEVAGREEERLSANFRVRELAAGDGARYARISPVLVEALQQLRTRLGSAITIVSGYRHPGLNASQGGAPWSSHAAGLAADVRSGSMNPTELARRALAEFGGRVAVGLGDNSVHVDLRGFGDTRPADRTTRAARGAPTGSDAVERPRILGPEAYDPASEAPTFQVDPGDNRYFAVEVATDWRLFDSQTYHLERAPESFHPADGYAIEEAGGPTIYSLPEDAWQRLKQAPRLYYRVLTLSAPSDDWPNLQASTPDEEAAEAPSIELTTTRRAARLPRRTVPTPATARRQDEALWRNPR